MPVVGIIDVDGRLVPTEEAIEWAARDGHYDGYPLGVIQQATRRYRNKLPSASQLAFGNYRQIILERNLDYYVKPSNQMALIRGSLVHAGFEALPTPPGTTRIREKRLKAMLPWYKEWEISGQADVYYPEHGRLEDYKTCRRVPEHIKERHIKQLAVYTWLLRWNGYPVSEVQINYVAWSQMRIRRTVKVDGSVIPAADHPLVAEENKFLEWIEEPYEILWKGFRENVIPSLQYCSSQYHRYSPVLWACDLIDKDGEVIDPVDFRQEELWQPEGEVLSWVM
jgi:hypothetical protein